MKVGIFSGSFDPVHIGHAMIANYLSQFCGLDEVWLMPSPLNPLKQDAPPAPLSCRMDMARIVARKCHKVVVSDFEHSLPLPSYTYRTLRALRDRYPVHDFSLVIGSDNWRDFHLWRNHDDIIREFPVIVYPRPGFEAAGEMPPGITLLGEAPQSLISSTFIRAGIAARKNMNFFLDPEVVDYIKTHSLYE